MKNTTVAVNSDLLYPTEEGLSIPKNDTQEDLLFEKTIKRDIEYLKRLYVHLHQHPELSYFEKETSKRMAAELTKLGFEVTKNIGGYGVVGVLKNGAGPTILIRTDMDALPVKEETGRSFASTVKAVNEAGQEVGVMHACGHDIHMTVWTGAARLLTQLKDQWSGTLVFVAQPAEEQGYGAKAMITDGLYQRFPRPDAALALHVNSELPAGTLAYTPGYTFANVELMEIIVRGVGGHGAYPHTTKNPILLAARIVEAMQSIGTNDLAASDPVVISVGTISGGTKANVVPDEVKIGLSIRSYSDETHEKIRRSINRICHGVAIAAGLEEDLYPIISPDSKFAPSTYNDPTLTGLIAAAFVQQFGKERVVQIEPAMTGEDFGQFGRTEEKIPIFLFWLGAVEHGQYASAKAAGHPLPSLHNSRFIPDTEPTIKTGVAAMATAALKLLEKR